MKLFKRTSVLLILIGWTPLIAQSEIRNWESGTLQWSDFRTAQDSDDIPASILKYELNYKIEKRKNGDSSVVFYQTTAGMRPGSSWVKNSEKTPHHLEYNQRVFDLVELHRRELFEELNSIGGRLSPEEALQKQLKACQDAIGDLEQKTRFGSDLKELRNQGLIIDKELRKDRGNSLPEHPLSDWQISWLLGYGANLFKGDLENNITNLSGFTLGQEVRYRNTSLNLDLIMGRSSVHRSFSEADFTFQEGNEIGMSQINLTIGQTIGDSKRFRLMPFAGMGRLQFTSPVEDSREFFRMTSYTPLAGLNADIKLKKTNSIAPHNIFSRPHTMTTHAIRVKWFVQWSSFETISAPVITGSIAYSFTRRKFKEG